MINQINERDYKRYLNMAYVISNRKEGGDLLHNVLLKIERLKKSHQILTDSFIFISLKNYFYTEKRLNKMVDNEYEIEKLKEISEEEEINYKEMELKESNKIDFIRREILSYRSSDIKLFELHFITWNDRQQKFGYSQRRIAKEIGVSHQLINQKVRRIIDDLNKKWNNKK